MAGLRWQDDGEAPARASGTELVNAALAAALQRRRTFTRAELDSFDIRGLTYSSFVRVPAALAGGPDRYYKPAPFTRADETCNADAIKRDIQRTPLCPLV